jgi:hypothetical protein
MSQQQTVLRVQTNNNSLLPNYEVLDLYSDIPIKLNKSYAELQDIGKKNTEYSIGLTLPGSKTNNRFFENFFNVDTQSLFFNVTKRNNCDVLLGDEPLFRGYLKLNKVSVMESKIEYDVTLYSTIANLFGAIGNNLLSDLPFNDPEYKFNHTFSLTQVWSNFFTTNFSLDQEQPRPYFYPVVHNGYNYVSGDTVNVSGTTETQTRKYSSTGPINSYSSPAAAWAAGVQQYRINSPTQGLRDNQLKPALSVWNLMKLIFKNYGYTITSDFFNTPWFKALYMYGYYSAEDTKFSYKITNIGEYPLEGIEAVAIDDGDKITVYVCKLGTGIPSYSLSDFVVDLNFTYWDPTDASPVDYSVPLSISAFSTGNTYNYPNDWNFVGMSSGQVGIGSSLRYLPKPVGSSVPYIDGDFVNFSLVIDPTIKQIDFISSIAKKFNLVFINNPDNPIDILIEPYDYYVGTGKIYDWTDKLSYDKGWSVEPALNFVESELIISDLEDGDAGNKQFKDVNNRIYGRNMVLNPTDFKSQEKKIETIFSPELIRKWDDENTNNIGLPLGVNYSVKNNDDNGIVKWQYGGIKTKPKLFFWEGAFNPFLDQVGEVFNNPGSYYPTYAVYLSSSNLTGSTSYQQSNTLPVISHTMPMGISDEYKKQRGFENDSLCVLFNSEEPVNLGPGLSIYKTYTKYDAYNRFYNNRITNIYSPNTRFLSGYFNLKYSDVKNLRANDIIKIQEQYFIWNKISEFNLTNRELTKVELIQLNVNPQVYPTRYFVYYYCDDPTKCYKFKTDFTNPNILDTNFGWSVYYDHQVGSLTGQTSGFTSTFVNVEGFSNVRYVPYTMYEVTKYNYDNSSCQDWTCDTMTNYIWENGPFSVFYMPSFWINSGSTKTGINVWNNCTDFYSTASTYGILTGSSVYHGTTACGTPTPTPTTTNTPTPTPTSTSTSTPTPTPTSTPAGCTSNNICAAIVVTGATGPEIYAGSISYNNCNGVLINENFVNDGTYYRCIQYISGVIQVFSQTGIESVTIYGGNCNTFSCPTGSTVTPTPTPTSTATPTPTVTSTPTNTPTNTPTPSPTPTNTSTPTPTPSPTPSFVALSVYTGNSLTNACNSTTLQTVYYQGTLGVGTILYETAGLSTPIVPTVYLKYEFDNTVYVVGTPSPTDGYITSITSCPSPTPTPSPTPVTATFDVYESCPNPLTYYYVDYSPSNTFHATINSECCEKRDSNVDLSYIAIYYGSAIYQPSITNDNCSCV